MGHGSTPPRQWLDEQHFSSMPTARRAARGAAPGCQGLLGDTLTQPPSAEVCTVNNGPGDSEITYGSSSEGGRGSQTLPQPTVTERPSCRCHRGAWAAVASGNEILRNCLSAGSNSHGCLVRAG